MYVDIELVITDLDNTLYDWVTFFASSFYAMVSRAAEILGTPSELLLNECRSVHQYYGDSEAPFALLDTPSVREQYRGLSRQEQAAILDPAFHAFNRERERTLRLYPGVRETLTQIKANVPVVGHTEASATNALFRLKKLGIDTLVTPVYALEHAGAGHPDPARIRDPFTSMGVVKLLRQEQRKPDRRVLLDICRDQRVVPQRALYVGDSIARDIGMAKAAGVWAAWAKYGTVFDKVMWDRLVRITHWTAKDVERARYAEDLYGKTKADRVLETGLHELLEKAVRGEQVAFRFMRSAPHC